MHWQKPLLGMIEANGNKRNNIVMPHSGVVSGVFLDEREPDPDRRYKMLHMWQGYKVHASYSADGLNWKPFNQGLPVLFVPPGHDSHMAPYWDEGLGKYVAIVRDRTGRIAEVRPRLATDPEAVETMAAALGPPARASSPQSQPASSGPGAQPGLRALDRRTAPSWARTAKTLSTGTSSTTWRSWPTTGCAWA